VRRPLVVVLGSLAVFAAIAAEVGAGGPSGWDTAIADAVADVAPVASSDVHFDPFMEGITIAVGGLTLVFGAWLLAVRRFRAALFLLGAIGGAVALSTLAKALVERPPIEGPADEFTFPSGSATWSMATAASVLLLSRSRRELAALAVAAALLVVGLGAVIVWEEWHYPSDVLAGWCLALGWATGLWLALGRPAAPSGRAERLTPPARPFDTPAEKEERSAAAPSVPAARHSGGTDTSA
jgi:undecaprenyl-diphosphatase